jgi:hypothetical protein
MRYADFRTGFTYHDVFAMLWTTSEESRDWRYKRRNTILGKWHQIKVELWERHLDGCAPQAESEAEHEPEMEGIPF